MSLVLDVRGARCPWPVLRLARAMREADAVTVLADDPAAPGEIAALARSHGWRCSVADHAINVTKPLR